MTSPTAQQLRIESNRFGRGNARKLRQLADGMEKSGRFAVVAECVLAETFERATGKGYSGCQGRFIDWLRSLDWRAIAEAVKLLLSILVLFI